MSKIRLVQSIQVLDSEMKYSDILKEAYKLKRKIQIDLKEEDLEDEFEVIVEVKNDRESFVFKNY